MQGMNALFSLVRLTLKQGIVSNNGTMFIFNEENLFNTSNIPSYRRRYNNLAPKINITGL